MDLFKNLKIFNFTNGIELNDVIMRKGQGVSYFVENEKGYSEAQTLHPR